MVISFVISIFDIIDMQEFTHLNGSEIFSTTNPHTDNEDDSLASIGISYTTISNIILPESMPSCEIERTQLKALAPQSKLCHFYIYTPKSINHPPKFC